MNILFITADQYRYDYLGFRGTSPVNTPNLDILAKSGAVHEHAYTINPLCMPARCSLLTGLYSHQHGIANNCGDLSPHIPTMPKVLRENGYETAIIGKVHFFEGIPGNIDYTRCREEVYSYGFDYAWLTSGKSMQEYCEDDWTYHLKDIDMIDAYKKDLIERNKDKKTHSSILPEEDTVDYVTAHKAIDYIKQYKKETPFFLWLSFCNPHFPFDPIEKYHKKYENVKFPEPIGCCNGMKEFWKRHAVAYAAMIEQLDYNIGIVLDAVKEMNLLDETLIVFTSDHGEMLGDHNVDSKNHSQDGSVRVPFIASNRKLVKPGIYDQAVEITDTVATFLDVAGVKDIQKCLPESPSQSLLDLWQGGRMQREYAFIENGYQFEQPFMSLCNGYWKYTYYSFTGKEVLSDLKNDPDEMENIALKYPEKIAEFRSLLLRRIGATPVPAPPFWVMEKTTGEKSPSWHHGPQNRNTGLDDLI